MILVVVVLWLFICMFANNVFQLVLRATVGGTVALILIFKIVGFI